MCPVEKCLPSMRNAFQPFPTAVAVPSTDPRLSHARATTLITLEAEKARVHRLRSPAQLLKRIGAAVCLSYSAPVQPCASASTRRALLADVDLAAGPQRPLVCPRCSRCPRSSSRQAMSRRQPAIGTRDSRRKHTAPKMCTSSGSERARTSCMAGETHRLLDE